MSMRTRIGLAGWCLMLLPWSVVASAQPKYDVFVPNANGPYANGPYANGPYANGPALAQPGKHSPEISLTAHDSTVEYVLSEVARQAHMRVVFDSSRRALARRITVRLQHATLAAALKTVLHGTGLSAQVAPDSETIMVRAKDAGDSEHGVQSDASSATVTGRVVDSATGRGLSSATVKVQGTKLSAMTADSGAFVIRGVPVGDQVISVRLFGYRPVTRIITVEGDTPLSVRIAMTSVPTILAGVVTTATGLQQKIAVGNDITTINVDSVMRVAPVMSVTDLLETRVPGLTVVHSSGVPGDPARIRLRGVGSVQLNNDPVVVVDGVRVYASQSDPRNQNLAPQFNAKDPTNVSMRSSVPAPSPLDQIDPNSIETVEVLKGPSATATYGSDAANGVIVITTKRGRAGPTQWIATLGQGVNYFPGQWPVHYYRFGSDWAVNLQSGVCLWTNVHCTIDSVVPFQALNDPDYTIFSHGWDQIANLSVSGGSPTLQYSVSGSAGKDVGNLKLPNSEQRRYEQLYGSIPRWMIRPENYQTWSGTGQLTAKPSTTVQVSLISSLFNSTQQRSSLENAIGQLEGEYINAKTVFSLVGPTYDLGTTPLITGEVERVTDHQLNATNTLALTWQPYAWLPLMATAGINTIQRADQSYIPSGVNASGPGANCGGLACDTTGFFGLGRGTSQDNTLNIGTTIPFYRQRITLALGGNYHSGSTADFEAYTRYLPTGVSSPSSLTRCPSDVVAGTCFDASQSSSSASTYGWYVEPRLNVNSRFFVTPGFRLDGGSGGSRVSSTGGSTGSLTAFPKIDFSWVAVDRQGTTPLLGTFTLLRPRLAFGLAGTQPGPADKLRLFNVGEYALSSTGGIIDLAQSSSLYCPTVVSLDGGNTTVPAVCLNGLGNTQLRPERSRELEGGFDATLWSGLLTLTYTQYNKTRTDAILSIPVAPSVVSINGGSTNYQKNIGVIRNTGTEMTVNAVVLQNRALSWNVGGNFSNNRNVVVRLNPGQAPFCLFKTTSCIKPGYPLFGTWSQPIVSFADANHNGIIEPAEVRLADSAVFLGEANPKYQMTLTSDLALFNGQLSVHADVAYVNGLTQMNEAMLNSGSFFALANPANTPLAVQAAIAAGCGNIAGSGALFNSVDCFNRSNVGVTQTVSTLRFQTFSVNYHLPTTVSTWFRVPRMTVALQGSNLGLHTNYRGKDPNVNAFATAGTGDQTQDLGQIPEPRTWWLKVTLGN